MLLALSSRELAASAEASDGQGAAEVTVQGQKAANAGSKLREPLRDVAATVNTVTAKTLTERAITDLPTALGNVAGVNPVLQYGGFTYLTIRGFKDFVVITDGARDDRYYFVESAPTSNLTDVERIDVLKGPSSALYGYGGIGGVVAITRKAPTADLRYGAGITVGGPKVMQRAFAGVGGPWRDDSLLYRIDAGIVDDLDFRGAHAESAKVAGAVAWLPHRGHRIEVRGSFARDRFNTDTGLPTDESGAVPAGIPRNRRFNTRQDFLSSRTFEVGATYSASVTDRVELQARLNYVLNPYRYASAETLGLGPEQTVTRGWYYLEHRWKPLYGALEVRANGQLLVPHLALAGYELGVMFSQHPRADLGATELLPVAYANSVDPQGGYAITRRSRLDLDQTTHALYAHDTLTLPAGFKLALGGRLDVWSFRRATYDVDPTNLRVLAETGAQDRHTAALTWRGGVVYQPTGWAAAYGSVATAFSPARQVPADNRQLSPERGRQVELGIRLETPDRTAQINVAAYDIEKTDVVVDRGLGVYDQAGRQTSRGVEVDAHARPWRGADARFGYAYTHARYRHYEADGSDYSGRAPANVSDHTFTMWATHRFDNGFGVGVGARAIGTSYADPANRVPLPAYALADVALYYRFANLELALNVNNVLGAERYFVSSINGTQLTPGSPRVALASLRIVP